MREARTLEEMERLLSKNGSIEKQERDRIMAEYKKTTESITQQMAEQRKNQVNTTMIQCKVE